MWFRVVVGVNPWYYWIDDWALSRKDNSKVKGHHTAYDPGITNWEKNVDTFCFLLLELEEYEQVFTLWHLGNTLLRLYFFYFSLNIK